jgi:hypothetical protein
MSLGVTPILREIMGQVISACGFSCNSPSVRGDGLFGTCVPWHHRDCKQQEVDSNNREVMMYLVVMLLHNHPVESLVRLTQLEPRRYVMNEAPIKMFLLN